MAESIHKYFQVGTIQRMSYPNRANDTPELLDYLRVLKEDGFFNAEGPSI